MPPLKQLNVYRHDRPGRALVTLAGELDLQTAPQVEAVLAGCLRDGVRKVDVDLTAVTFCDCSGLNVFLDFTCRMAVPGHLLRLHRPTPPVARLFDLVAASALLLGIPVGPLVPGRSAGDEAGGTHG